VIWVSVIGVLALLALLIEFVPVGDVESEARSLR